MTLTRKGAHAYGEGQADIREELRRYGKHVGYVPSQFAEATCACGGRTFRLLLDEEEGAAVRACPSCGGSHPMGDSAEFLEEASLEECGCPCGNDLLELTLGVSLYEDSEDVRWLYVGCRCPRCGLTACYGDWKNEFTGYRSLLAAV
jgi:hypothetical protein